VAGLHEFEHALVLAQVEGAGTAGQDKEVEVVSEAVVEEDLGFYDDCAFARDLEGIRTRGESDSSACAAEQVDGSYALDFLEAVGENNENGLHSLSSFSQRFAKSPYTFPILIAPDSRHVVVLGTRNFEERLGLGQGLEQFFAMSKGYHLVHIAMDDE
jgi:hypothetical protein